MTDTSMPPESLAASADPRGPVRGPEATSRASRISDALAGDWRLAPVCLSLAVVWIFFSLADSSFLSSRNITNLSLQIVVTGVLALGLVLVLLIAEIDLSVAAVSGVTSAVMASLAVNHGWAPTTAVLAAILVGAAVGLVQGAVVVFGAPSFVVTLGGSLIMSGVLLLLLPSAGQINLADNPISNLANTFLAPWLGWALACAALAFFAWLRWSECPGRERSELLREVAAPLALAAVVVLALVGVFSSYQGVPLAVAIFLGLLLALWYVTKQTRFGTYLYAIGGNREAARRAGVHVGRLRLATFVIAGACAALAGVLAASRLLGVSTQAGGGPLLLQAVAAAVIGGASLFGGRGSVWAALLGALVIGSISNGLDLLGSADEVKLIVQGAILIIAVTLDAVISRGSLRPSAGRLPR